MDAEKQAKFLALYCMILADGVIAAEELTRLYEIGRENYDLTQEEISKAVTEAGTSFILPEKLKDKVTLLYQLSEIAWADGKIEAPERSILEQYTRLMGFEEENIDGIVKYMLQQVHDNIPLEDVLSEIIS